jgi:hypothetical protein
MMPFANRSIHNLFYGDKCGQIHSSDMFFQNNLCSALSHRGRKKNRKWKGMSGFLYTSLKVAESCRIFTVSTGSGLIPGMREEWKTFPLIINPILHICFTSDGSSTIQVFLCFLRYRYGNLIILKFYSTWAEIILPYRGGRVDCNRWWGQSDDS